MFSSCCLISIRVCKQPPKLSLPCGSVLKGEVLTRKRKNSPPLAKDSPTSSSVSQDSLRGLDTCSTAWQEALRKGRGAPGPAWSRSLGTSPPGGRRARGGRGAGVPRRGGGPAEEPGFLPSREPSSQTRPLAFQTKKKLAAVRGRGGLPAPPHF